MFVLVGKSDLYFTLQQFQLLGFSVLSVSHLPDYMALSHPTNHIIKNAILHA